MSSGVVALRSLGNRFVREDFNLGDDGDGDRSLGETLVARFLARNRAPVAFFLALSSGSAVCSSARILDRFGGDFLARAVVRVPKSSWDATEGRLGECTPRDAIDALSLLGIGMIL